MVGADETVVLDCYWLAQWYHQNPEVFLSMPLSQIQTHVMRSNQLAELRRARQSADSDGD